MTTYEQQLVESAAMSDQAIVAQKMSGTGMDPMGHHDPIWLREVGAEELSRIVSDPPKNVAELSGSAVEDDCHVYLTGTYNTVGGLRSQDDWRAVITGVRGLNLIQITAMQAGIIPSPVNHLRMKTPMDLMLRLYTTYQSGYCHLEIRDTPRSELLQQMEALLLDPAGAIRFLQDPEAFTQRLKLYSDAENESSLDPERIEVSFEGPRSGQLRVLVSWMPSEPEPFSLASEHHATVSRLMAATPPPPTPPPPPPPPGGCLTCAGTTAWQNDRNVTMQVHTIAYTLWFPPT